MLGYISTYYHLSYIRILYIFALFTLIHYVCEIKKKPDETSDNDHLYSNTFFLVLLVCISY